MKPNATLRIDHFRWGRGTRVEAVSYWVTENHIRIRFPAVADKGEGQIWTLPSESVKLDKGVKLKIKEANSPPGKALQGKH